MTQNKWTRKTESFHMRNYRSFKNKVKLTSKPLQSPPKNYLTKWTEMSL